MAEESYHRSPAIAYDNIFKIIINRVLIYDSWQHVVKVKPVQDID
jgi:hypothetical protein